MQAAAEQAAHAAAASTREHLSHLEGVAADFIHGDPITEKKSTFQVQFPGDNNHLQTRNIKHGNKAVKNGQACCNVHSTKSAAVQN